MKNEQPLKVAIVHDWLVGGGAELVVKELHELYPEAPIYTSYCTDEWRQKLDNRVVTGFLQRWPFSRLRKYLPVLRIWWFTHLDLADFDLVISSSGNGEAKFVLPKNDKWKMTNGNSDMKRPLHICYCHTPTHFYWRHHNYYVKHPGFGPFASLGLKILVSPLRHWDYRAAQRPDLYIANSTHIQRDIEKYYDRKSVVIHPPVDVERFQISDFSNQNSERSGFVTVGRQVPYKRVDIIVDACSKLDLPLIVIGNGPEHENLVKRAGKNVKFITDATDDDVVRYMSGAKAFILAAFEDFGITPVEALASGTPVIAYQAGGALDYIIPGKNGEFFAEQTVESLTTELKNFNASKYNSGDIKQSAQKFSTQNFHKTLQTFLTSVLK